MNEFLTYEKNQELDDQYQLVKDVCCIILIVVGIWVLI